MTPCPWCGLEYDLMPDTEKAHLAVCSVFQKLPVAETTSDGRTFVALPDDEGILVERVRVN